nr:AAA family ATPase [Streptomyces coriariae]
MPSRRLGGVESTATSLTRRTVSSSFVSIGRQPMLPLLAARSCSRAGRPDEHADALLALGLFHAADLTVPVRNLSVGQRRKLELARLVTAGPLDLLLLDEPTNHLAPALVEEIEAALARYTGTLVVVTHDRLLRERFHGRHLELPVAAEQEGRN